MEVTFCVCKYLSSIHIEVGHVLCLPVYFDKSGVVDGAVLRTIYTYHRSREKFMSLKDSVYADSKKE